MRKPIFDVIIHTLWPMANLSHRTQDSTHYSEQPANLHKLVFLYIFSVNLATGLRLLFPEFFQLLYVITTLYKAGSRNSNARNLGRLGFEYHLFSTTMVSKHWNYRYILNITVKPSVHLKTVF